MIAGNCVIILFLIALCGKKGYNQIVQAFTDGEKYVEETGEKAKEAWYRYRDSRSDAYNIINRLR